MSAISLLAVSPGGCFPAFHSRLSNAGPTWRTTVPEGAGVRNPSPLLPFKGGPSKGRGAQKEVFGLRQERSFLDDVATDPLGHSSGNVNANCS